MWIFLLTEVLLFGGLFCAYAVYRANRPEIFHYAYEHRFLDVNLGALNTVILIFSSFTMAWAVRCAQLGKQRGLIALLTITLVCGGLFLGNKYLEYKHKWEERLLPGKHFGYQAETGEGSPAVAASPPASSAAPQSEESPPEYVAVFFGIYFMMTGLHALHVAGGMGAIAWLIWRAAKGHFTRAYFGPVDYVGLYWHLVDIIWIYLFPLLYLIH